MNDLEKFSVDLLDEFGHPEDSFDTNDLSEAMEYFDELKPILHEGQNIQLWFRDPEDHNNLFLLKQI